MELLEAHWRAMSGFDGLVRLVDTDEWRAPTPCTDWNVHALVNHVVSEQLWAPHLIAGATLAEVGDRFDGDVLEDDPIGAWADAAAAARNAFIRPSALSGTVHVTGGQIEAEEYAWQMTTDLAVHGWDLAIAIDMPQPIEESVAAVLDERIRPRIDHWQGLGIFAPPVPVDDTAGAVARLLALLGRDPGGRAD
jgi:uncharacterized protein (TIGR03086 family)